MIRVNNIYPAIQGEGVHTGVPMVIVRLQGCSVVCHFCDTRETWPLDEEYRVKNFRDALGQNQKWIEISAIDIAYRIKKTWPAFKWVLITGGEPAEQDLTGLVSCLHNVDYNVALETSGTAGGFLGAEVDWICVSPKIANPAGKPLLQSVIKQADELKCIVGKQQHIIQFEHLLQKYKVNADTYWVNITQNF